MRTLAIDLGARRVGLALSDEGGRFATPLDVLRVQTPEEARRQVLAAIKAHQPTRLVVGIPLNMDGTLGPAVTSTLIWARELARQAALPLVLVDERLSSFDAEQQLIDRKRQGERLTRKNKRDRLDALAAAAFLQAFLDGQLGALELP